MFDSFIKTWRIFDAHARRRAAFLLVLLILGALAEAGSVALIFPLLDITMNPGQSDLKVFGWSLKDVVGDTDQQNILWVFVAAFAIYLAKNLFLIFTVRYQGGFIWDTLSTLWIRLFRVYLYWPLSRHAGSNTSTLVNNVTIAVRNVFYSFVMPLISFIAEFLVIAALGLILLVANPQVTVAAIAILTLTVGIYHFAFRRALTRWGREQLEENRLMLLWLNQGLAGIKEIRLLGSEDIVERSFAKSARRNGDYARRNLLITQLPRYIVEIVLIGAVLAGIYGAYMITGDIREPLPYLALFGFAAIRLMPSVSRATTYASQIRFGAASIDVVYNDLVLSAAADAARQPLANEPRLHLDRAIDFENVSFNYADGSVPALEDVTLKIAKGEFVALVGSSGAGKTTLADLAAALMEPTSGRILVDGQPIGAKSRAWQRNIGYVPQDIFLLDDTLAKNVAFGAGDADIDRKLRNAIALSALQETVDALPAGMDTRIGERGVRFSGGQKQRIGIARSLMRDAEVLILDEATSALDSETEHRITRVIEALRGDKTLIVIAHRLSTVRRCDRLYFLDKGKLVDHGPFEELYRRNPMFREMVDKMDVSVDAA